MARVAERRGILRERMLLEEHAIDTGDSARRCARLLESLGYERGSRIVVIAKDLARQAVEDDFARSVISHAETRPRTAAR